MSVDHELSGKYLEDQFDLLRRSLDFYIAVESGKQTLYTRNRQQTVSALGFVLLLANIAAIVLLTRYVPEPYSGLLFIFCAGASFFGVCHLDEHIRKTVRRFIMVLHALHDYDDLIGRKDPSEVLHSRERLAVYRQLLEASSESGWELPYYFYNLLR